MPNPNASPPADPQVLTLFQEELARAAVPDLAAPGAALWPRFAGYYQGLTRLPRRLRRALQRQWRRSLGGIALLCALGQAPALAATINVDGTTCTLVDAITAANNDAPTGGCEAGSGADDVFLPNVFLGGGSVPPLTAVNNSTVSGNTAADRGGAVDNAGTVTFTNSTVTANASGRGAGGLFNTGAVTLVQSLLSGNTAPVIGPEAYSVSGNVFGNGFNVFGHDSFSGVAGFTLGATDLVPAVPLSAILDPTLGYNGGATKTHSLVFGSPAVDTIPAVACATATDQRGALRPQDADGDTVTDCDSGAVERGLIPVQAEITNTTLACNSTACRVSVKCNLQETECTNPIDIAVRTRALRASDGTLVKASKLIRFAAGVTNIPPGGTQQLRAKLSKQGKRLVRATKKRRLKGVLGIREIATTVSVSNTPLTISRTDVTIRLKRRK